MASFVSKHEQDAQIFAATNKAQIERVREMLYQGAAALVAELQRHGPHVLESGRNTPDFGSLESFHQQVSSKQVDLLSMFRTLRNLRHSFALAGLRERLRTWIFSAEFWFDCHGTQLPHTTMEERDMYLDSANSTAMKVLSASAPARTMQAAIC